MAFLNPDVVCFGYSPTEYATFNIPTMSVTDISTPPPPQPSTTTGAFTGLSGYMALALGARQKPEVLQVAENEGLITKDTEGIFVGPEGRVTRPSTIQWPTAPEDIAYVKPYIFCAFPAGTVPDRASPPNMTQQFHTTSVIRLYSALSMQAVQTVPYPFTHPDSTSTATLASTSPTKASSTAAPNATLRLLTTSPQPKSTSKSPLRVLALSTPTDKTAAASEGRTTAAANGRSATWLHTPLSASASASTPATSPPPPRTSPRRHPPPRPPRPLPLHALLPAAITGTAGTLVVL
ncbi:hypothetical protein EV714DRAFT_240602, partial [Schizophyllum commune]